jgi:hypothetical protein
VNEYINNIGIDFNSDEINYIDKKDKKKVEEETTEEKFKKYSVADVRSIEDRTKLIGNKQPIKNKKNKSTIKRNSHKPKQNEMDTIVYQPVVLNKDKPKILILTDVKGWA